MQSGHLTPLLPPQTCWTSSCRHLRQTPSGDQAQEGCVVPGRWGYGSHGRVKRSPASDSFPRLGRISGRPGLVTVPLGPGFIRAESTAQVT